MVRQYRSGTDVVTQVWFGT